MWGKMFVQEIYAAEDFRDGKLIEEIYDFWRKQDKYSIWLRFGSFVIPKREDYERIILRAELVVFARDEEGKLIGYSEGCPRIDNHEHVELGVAVDQKYRRNGVAMGMVDIMYRECSCLGFKKMEAYIIQENLIMRALATKFEDKFPVMQEFKDGYFHTVIDLMEIQGKGKTKA
jgi:hypothetical protein